VAGAAAGVASRTATAPLETVRLQAMTGAGKAGKPLAAARSVVAASGWQALCAPHPSPELNPEPS
jgi:solute carrier family 25 phosphate transporter 23/24/25/41